MLMIFSEIRVIVGAKGVGLMIVGDDLSPIMSSIMSPTTVIIIDVAHFNFVLF